VKDVLHDIADTDERIALVRLNTSDPVAALNELLARARTPYVWRIHENDELSPFAIEACARQISTEPDCRILVADDDSLDGYGSRFAPRFKPQTFSIELFHSYNYFGRAAILHTDSVRGAGGWRAGFSGAEDYDLLLRLSETCPPPSIRHLALVLYHERQSSAGPARISRKELNAAGAGLRALTDHFSRMSVPATIEHVPPTMYRVRYHIAEPKPLLSIIIPFRDRADLLRPCIASILDRSTYRNFEMLLINNGSCEPETRDLLHSYRSDNRIRIIDDAGPFNYSALNNNAARIAQGSFYCLLNNDTQVIAADWIEDMLGYASQSGIGCVGAKLFYGNGLVQHAGMLLGLPSGAEHALRCATPDDPGYLNRLTVASNCSCVTGACLVISRRIFWEVGGLNEALPVTFNDVDLCIKVSKAGYRNVFTPFARLFHFEASTRGSDLLPQNMIRFNNELEFMRVRHGQDLTDDPYYSPHLTRKKTDFTIRLDYDGT
jgi:GT2 family glycosyltransferase